jgi:SHS2 domain-containing protein
LFRWVEHTGELELEIEADSRRGVFEQAFEAIRELLAEDPGGPEQTREMSLSAPDGPALLVEWLSELAFLGETEGLVPVGISELRLGERELSGEIVARRAHPPHLVKGATYHRLTLERTDEGWRATVVLDV